MPSADRMNTLWMIVCHSTPVAVTLVQAFSARPASIIGISSIHLLKTFIEAGMIGGLPLCGSELGLQAVQAMKDSGSILKACTSVTAQGVMWQTIIHSVFILSALGIAWTDRLMVKAGREAQRAH